MFYIYRALEDLFANSYKKTLKDLPSSAKYSMRIIQNIALLNVLPFNDV